MSAGFRRSEWVADRSVALMQERRGSKSRVVTSVGFGFAAPPAGRAPSRF